MSGAVLQFTTRVSTGANSIKEAFRQGIALLASTKARASGGGDMPQASSQSLPDFRHGEQFRDILQDLGDVGDAGVVGNGRDLVGVQGEQIAKRRGALGVRRDVWPPELVCEMHAGIGTVTDLGASGRERQASVLCFFGSRGADVALPRHVVAARYFLQGLW